MALYQDLNLTTGVDMSSAGNSPTWAISGAVYLPHSNVTLSGAVNKASNGSNCFVILIDEIPINGTGDILAGDMAASCAAAGLNVPTASVPGPRSIGELSRPNFEPTRLSRTLNNS